MKREMIWNHLQEECCQSEHPSVVEGQLNALLCTLKTFCYVNSYIVYGDSLFALFEKENGGLYPLLLTFPNSLSCVRLIFTIILSCGRLFRIRDATLDTLPMLASGPSSHCTPGLCLYTYMCGTSKNNYSLVN